MSDLRQGLKPFEAPRPLDFGTAIHKGMEVAYAPTTWDIMQNPATRGIIVANSVQAFRNEMARIKARYLRLSGNEGLDDEQRSMYEEDLDLGEGMLRHYFDYVQRKDLDKFTPIAAEIDFEVDIFTPEEIAEFFPHLSPCRIVYRGRLDLLVRDHLGQYWVMDHKTAKSFRDVLSFLELEEQMSSYIWAVGYMLGIDIVGNIYAEILKGYPQPLKENKVVRKGCRFSVNKEQPTSYEIAKAQLEEAGEPLEPYEDYLRYLQLEGVQYVRRTEVRRNRHEMQEMHRRIKDEVRDMLDPNLRIYPSPKAFGCDGCPVRNVCLAMNDGSDYQWILDNHFTKEKRNNAQQST